MKDTINTTIRIPIFFLSILSLLVSITLLDHHVKVTSGYLTGPSSCTINETFNCETVTLSKYSELFSIPIASFGLIFSLGLLLFTIFGNTKLNLNIREFKSILFFAITTTLIGAVIYLLLSIFVIKALCPYCLVFDTILFILFIVSFRSIKNELSIISGVLEGLKSTIEFIYQTFTNIKRHKTRIVFISIYLLGIYLIIISPNYLSENIYSKRKIEVVTDLKNLFNDVFSFTNAKSFSKEDLLTNNKYYFKGADDAPITLIKFADFQCGHCKKSSEIIDIFLKNNPNSIKFIYKNFPLDGACNPLVDHRGNGVSCLASAMASCASLIDQETYLSVHQAIFSFDILTRNSLLSLPKKLGLPESFSNCIQNPHNNEQIIKDIELATKLGISGTPSFYIVRDNTIFHLPLRYDLYSTLEQLELYMNNK